MEGTRVVVTGMAAITPIGNDLDTSWSNLLAGKSGVGPITLFDTTAYATHIAAELKDFHPEERIPFKQLKRMDRFCQSAVVCALMLMEHAAYEVDPSLAHRTGCIMGCGLGGMETLEYYHTKLVEGGPRKVSPFMIPVLISNMAPGQISIFTGAKGPNLVTTSACASGLHGIGYAYSEIKMGRADAMITGGVESTITPLGLAGFNAMKALSTRNDEPERASRPFDRDRDGFIMGEGCGLMLLESLKHARERGATIYGEVVGFGASSDAFHMTAPEEEGRGMALAMRAAVDEAGLGLGEVDHINAHGTSTELNDLCENQGHQNGVRKPRQKHPHHLQQVHGGTSAGRGGRRGGGFLGHEPLHRDHSSHHQPGEPRRGVRLGLRPRGAAQKGHTPRPVQLLRLRRNQRLHPVQALRRLTKPQGKTMQELLIQDPEVGHAVCLEIERQTAKLELIASENFTSPAVREAMGSVLTHKYAEGYPGKRYYGGCEYVDLAEDLARDRARQLFHAEYANVQPHSGAQANMAVYFGALAPGDTLLGMNLSHGGHLTHGSPVNFSGKLYKIVSYGVGRETGTIDYDEVEKLALEHRPKVIVAGASAYSRTIDFARFREIADKAEAKLMVDMAHIAGLVAAELHPSPIPHAHFTTTTTHKTLRGPRGGMILSSEEFGKMLNSQVFPGCQGGPLMHIIAAKAVAFGEALKPEFKRYQQQVLDNAHALAQHLVDAGFDLVSSAARTTTCC